MAEVINLQAYKSRKKQERLKKVMRERYGTAEKELEAFLIANREGEELLKYSGTSP